MKALLLLLAVSLLSGCVIVTHEGNGTKTMYISPAFGTKAIAEADFQKGQIKGVSSEQSSMSDVMAGVYSAGIAAGKKAVIP